MTEAMEQAKAKAVEYLRWRGIYILESTSFRPTPAAGTDVRKTWEAYRKFIKKQEG
jgi:hypothetical protein